MGSLRTFIKDVRAAKTQAEERSIVTKESARIRTKLKDDHISQEKRRKNINKLLYLHILGEKTHFAQVECINLIASEDFRDKRLGYLAAMILLDEGQEILTLLTNMLNNDLNHPNRYVVSLALSTLGSLTSPELARDLYGDVQNILSNSKDNFLVKKALQCAAKLICRDASLTEVFYPYVSSIIGSSQVSSHGVLLGATKLCQAALLAQEHYEYDNYTQILESLVQNIPDLLSFLQDMNATSFNPEYDVSGTSDPFLQVELLHTLRLLFEKAPQECGVYQGKLNDLLTKIATNSNGTKNSAHAVLYECVRTIFALQLDQSLRVLAVNVLAKFLSGKDNNTKYVALNTLLHVAPQEPQTVQKHRKFISKCLFDTDVSIRTRAVELTFAILDESNASELVEELTAFLKVANEDDRDLIVYIVEHIINLFELHRLGDEKWALDATVSILKIVGEHISLDRVSDIMIMINNASDLHHKARLICNILNASLNKAGEGVDGTNLGWKLLSSWCIGEYADILLQEGNFVDTELTNYLCSLDGLNGDNVRLISYTMSAALKLSAKVHNPSCVEDLRKLIDGHKKDTNLILQTKSIQYSIIFNQPTKQKQDILGAMPLFEKKLKSGSAPAVASKPTVTRKEPDLLLELLEEKPAKARSNQTTSEDLSDIFGLKPSQNKAVASQDKGDVLGKGQSVVAIASVTVPEDAPEVFKSSDLTAYMKLASLDQGGARFELFICPEAPIRSLQVLAAVSKSQKLALGHLSSTSIAAGQACKQELTVTGSGKLKFRIKLLFNAEGSGTSKTEQFDYKLNQSL